METFPALIDRIAEQIASQSFAQVLPIYDAQSGEVRQVVREMCFIINDPGATPEEVEMAVETLTEALYPSTPQEE